MTEQVKKTPYEEELFRLQQIDEISTRTGADFLQAKAALDQSHGSLVEAIAKIETQRQQEKEEKKAAIKEKYWQGTKNSVEGLKDYVKEKCSVVSPEEWVEEIKIGLKKPVGFGQVGGQTLQLPAVVVGAGMVGALYPFHRSKALTAVSAAALAAWFFYSNHGMSKAKQAIKKATEEYNREQQETEREDTAAQAFQLDDANRQDLPGWV